jgi:catechol 2,3-dioxygenase-like lactoylglutathione lyase family enzyme
MITGVSHLTFVCRDLDRMETMLTEVLGAWRVYDSGEATFSLSRERFYCVGGVEGAEDGAAGVWIAVMEGEPLPTRTYNHVAFRIDASDFETCLARIRALGLTVREGRPRVAGEGRSLYFYDADNHLFELHAGTLKERLGRYAQGR